jgi:hypothetical protein
VCVSGSSAGGEVVCAPDLHGYVRTPWCADILVCAERALGGHPRRMNVCARRSSPGRGQRVEAAEPTAGPCPCASARRFPRSASEQCSRVGGHAFVLFAAMSPTRNVSGKAAWGTSSGTSTGTGGVHNREHGAGKCRCMRANSDMRGGGKLPPPCDLRVRSSLPRGQSWAASSLRANPDSCGGANLAPPRDLGFY